MSQKANIGEETQRQQPDNKALLKQAARGHSNCSARQEFPVWEMPEQWEKGRSEEGSVREQAEETSLLLSPSEGSAKAPGTARPAKGTCCCPGAGKGRSPQPLTAPVPLRQTITLCSPVPAVPPAAARQPSQLVTANWPSLPQPVFPPKSLINWIPTGIYWLPHTDAAS